MGVGGGGQTKEASSVGTTPPFSFDAGIHSSEAVNEDRRTERQPLDAHTPHANTVPIDVCQPCRMQQ